MSVLRRLGAPIAWRWPLGRWLWLAALTLVLVLGLSGPVQAEHRTVHFEQAEMIEVLDGDVDASPPIRIDGDFHPQDWQPVSLPYQAPREALPPSSADRVVTRWFRLTINAPDDAIDEYVLYLPRWQTIGRLSVYVDGRLVFHSRGSAVWNAFNIPLWQPVSLPGVTAPPQTVLLRVVSLREAGLGLSSAWVGPRDDLIVRHRLRDIVQVQVPLMASAAFLAIGLFSLAVWAKRRHEAAYGFFFLASVLFFLRCLHYHSGGRHLLVPDDWFGWITLNSMGWLVVVVYLFTARLGIRRLPWVERGAVALMVAGSLLSLPGLLDAARLALVSPWVYALQWVVGVGVTLSALWMACRGRVREARWVAAWSAVNIPIGVHDWLLQNGWLGVEKVYLLPYTGIGLFIIFMGVVFRRYVGALSEAEVANRDLEVRLQERESALARSHERLREIERGQTRVQERQRLMQDMHDGLGSSLVSALYAVELGQLREQEVAQVLRECIDDLKLAIDSLEPAHTDLVMLLAALRFRLSPRLQASGMRLEWAVEDVPPLAWIDPRSALHILRILQEVFTNIIKHAGAHHIRVGTRHEGEHVCVTVDDDGQGFVPDLSASGGAVVAPSRGRGLANLARRATALGARVQWLPQQQGTRFELCLPLVSPLSPH
ncbi:ATP-binding protein [Hydrogenophaga sp.]|uniref:sensor histidine kinase n=1 Tax=Hydrogenophaga sp. TaxID=1904254 RepID=UPI00391A096B